MKLTMTLQHDKMKTEKVRESIDKAAKQMVQAAEVNGERRVSYERMREIAAAHAQEDNNKGKI